MDPNDTSPIIFDSERTIILRIRNPTRINSRKGHPSPIIYDSTGTNGFVPTIQNFNPKSKRYISYHRRLSGKNKNMYHSEIPTQSHRIRILSSSTYPERTWISYFVSFRNPNPVANDNLMSYHARLTGKNESMQFRNPYSVADNNFRFVRSKTILLMYQGKYLI